MNFRRLNPAMLATVALFGVSSASSRIADPLGKKLLQIRVDDADPQAQGGGTVDKTTKPGDGNPTLDNPSLKAAGTIKSQQQQQAQIGDAKQPGSYTPRDQAQQGTVKPEGQEQQQAQTTVGTQQMGEGSDDATTGAGTQAKKADSDLAEGTTLAKGSYVGEQQAAQAT